MRYYAVVEKLCDIFVFEDEILKLNGEIRLV